MPIASAYPIPSSQWNVKSLHHTVRSGFIGKLPYMTFQRMEGAHCSLISREYSQKEGSKVRWFNISTW